MDGTEETPVGAPAPCVGPIVMPARDLPEEPSEVGACAVPVKNEGEEDTERESPKKRRRCTQEPFAPGKLS